MSVDRHRLNLSIRRTTLGVVVGLLYGLTAAAQPGPAQPAKGAGAVKLPDGTIVLYTKTPDDPNPPVDGVVLTPQEYKSLVEQVDQFKKFKDAPKPQLPSGCAVAAKVVPRGERSVALLSVVFQVRTAAARTPVLLGCHKAFPVSAKLADGRVPVLLAGDDGLTAVPELAGDHTFTIELEAPITSRGLKGEQGFEIGLPKAAITTLAFEPPAGVKKAGVGVRTAGDKAGEMRVTSEDAGKLNRHPLGPVELLQVSWEPPSAPAAAAEAVLGAEADVVVRIDDSQVETTATLRLRGAAKEWTFVAPAGSEVTVDRAAGAKDPDPFTTGLMMALVKPTDPAKPVWTFRPPEGPGADWVVTVVSRATRPKSADGRPRGLYPVGPFAVPTAGRLTGTLKVFAPQTTRVSFPAPNPDVRRQDAPPAEDDLVALFRISSTTAAGKIPPPLLTLEARQSPGFVRVQPTYSLKRTETGWRLDLEAHVTPVRAEVEQLQVDVPAGWQAVEASPAELVEVQVPEGASPMAARTLTVRLTTPQKSPFDLTLTTVFSVPSGVRDASIPLPRFPGTQEQLARVTAAVPDGLEVHGTALGTEAGQASTGQELRAPPGSKPAAAVTAAVAQFERAAVRVDLNWQPYRPELLADGRAEVNLQDRQATVAQTIRFRAGEGEVRPIRFVGPLALTGLRGPLEPSRPGEWIYRPPADGAREFTLNLSYAIPLPPRKPDAAGPVRLPVGLLWPESATKVETTLRAWGGGTSRRIARFEGPWRELAPEPSPDRDALPWLTVAGTGPNLPLALDLADPSDAGVPTAAVERALIQAWVGDDGAVAVRGRFLLRRWSASGIDVELPAGINAEVKIDDRRVDPTPTKPGDAAEARGLRVPVPERTGKATLLLEVRYVLPATRDVELSLPPPRVASATYRTPARWQVIVPNDVVPLSTGRDVQADTHWAVSGGLFAPVAGASTRDLEQWLAGSAEPPADAEEPPPADALTARQPVLGPLPLLPVRRGLWVAVNSLAVLVVGYGLSRLRPAFLGPALAGIGVGIAVPAAGWPQLAAQSTAAGLPGLAALVVVLVALAAVKWAHRRRVERLPGFTRVRPESGIAAASAGGSRGPVPSGSAVVLEGTGSKPSLTTPSGS